MNWILALLGLIVLAVGSVVDGTVAIRMDPRPQ